MWEAPHPGKRWHPRPHFSVWRYFMKRKISPAALLSILTVLFLISACTDTEAKTYMGKYYTVTFNFSGVSAIGLPPIEMPVGKFIILPRAISRSGDYTFVGWTERIDGYGGVYNSGSYFTSTKDTTLYAEWLPATASVFLCTVRFDSRGELFHGQVVVVGYPVNIPAIDPVLEGYTFAGWYSDPGFTSLYDFSRPVSGDMTLYAAWN